VARSHAVAASTVLRARGGRPDPAYPSQRTLDAHHPGRRRPPSTLPLCASS